MQNAVYLTTFSSSQLQLAPGQGNAQIFVVISSLTLLLLPKFILALATFFFIFTYFFCDVHRACFFLPFCIL